VNTYDKCVCFKNGYTIVFLSADCPDTAHGLNLDQLVIDESFQLKESTYNTVLRKTLRANKYTYRNPRPGRKGLYNPLHCGIFDFTSAAWTPEQQWIYRTEELMKIKPSQYFFMKSTPYDNLANLPGNWIEQERESSESDLAFDIEVMNRLYKKVLSDNGWRIVDCVQNSYLLYKICYRVINTILSEKHASLPRIRINERDCKRLLISLKHTPIIGDNFEKDKSSEDSKTLDQQYATHLSDSFDYILFKKYSRILPIASAGSGPRFGKSR
jgi:hypothetical protein